MHYKYESIGNANIYHELDNMTESDRSLILEFKHQENINPVHVMNFHEFDEVEWIKIVLTRIHDQFFWLGDQPTKISKGLIHLVSGLNNAGIIASATKTLKKDVKNLTGSKWDKSTVTITNIRKQDVRLISMILGYKMHYRSRANSISIGIIHTA